MSYLWQDATAAEAIRADLNSAHDGPGIHHIEYHVTEEDGLLVKVVPVGVSADSVTPINDAHRCPPSCP